MGTSAIFSKRWLNFGKFPKSSRGFFLLARLSRENIDIRGSLESGRADYRGLAPRQLFPYKKMAENKLYKQGDYVWVDLGISYGWWPAEFQSYQRQKFKIDSLIFQNDKISKESNSENKSPNKIKDAQAKKKNSGNVLKERNKTTGDIRSFFTPKKQDSVSNEEKHPLQSETEKGYFVRFFDDEKYDWYRLQEASRIQTYSCPDKITLIRDGLKKFQTGNKNSLFDAQARQAQLYKDIEMAEVLTDNNPEVADILSAYEVQEEIEWIGSDGHPVESSTVEGHSSRSKKGKNNSGKKRKSSSSASRRGRSKKK